MNITSYSILTAIVYFNLFIIIFSFARRKDHIILYFGIAPMVYLCILATIRMLCMVEFPFTRVITSKSISWMYDMLTAPIGFGKYTVTIGLCLCAIWGFGAAIKLLQFICQMILDLWDFKKAEWITALDELSLCRQVTHGQTRMAFTDDQIPYIVGFFHPIIFVPKRSLSNSELKYVLMHEWQHFKSKDQWKKTAIKILSCLFWWNPFIHLLRFEIEQMLELSCDQKVLRRLATEEEQIAYLKVIRDFSNIKRKSREANKSLVSNIVPLFNKKYLYNPFRLLKQRLLLGMEYRDSSDSRKIRSVILCIAITFVFAASYIANFQPRHQPPAGESEISEFPEETVLKEKEDGTYMIVIDGEEWASLKNCDREPFASMPVIPFER